MFVFHFTLLAFALTFASLRAGEALDWEKLPPLPDRIGVAAPFAGISGGGLLVAGGTNFPDRMPWEGGKKVWHDGIWMLDGPDGRWRDVGRLRRRLAYGVSVTWHDSVVCVGGSDADQDYGDVFRLIWKNQALSIESLPALPISLGSACGALVGDVVYLAGGSGQPGEQSASSRAFALDLAAQSPAWREIPPIPGRGRILCTAGAYNEGFYVFGGAALEAEANGKMRREYLREAWCFRNGGWRRLADLPNPVAAAPSPAPVIQKRILLIAGDDGSRTDFQPIAHHPGFPPRILAYEIEQDAWSEVGETPTPRATLPVVQWDRMFILPGGEVRPGCRSPEVWALSPR
jgi:N-acetylneuraminic acid mutarotase